MGSTIFQAKFHGILPREERLLPLEGLPEESFVGADFMAALMLIDLEFGRLSGHVLIGTQDLDAQPDLEVGGQAEPEMIPGCGPAVDRRGSSEGGIDLGGRSLADTCRP